MSEGHATGSDLRARVLREIAQTPSPTRAEYNRQAALVVALGVLASAALFFGLGGVSRGERPVELVAFTSGFGLLVAVLVTRFAAGRSGSMLGRPRAALIAGSLASAAALVLVAFAAAARWTVDEPVSGTIHLACGALTVLQGAVPLGVLVVLRRGSDPVHPLVTGVALGTVAGAWSAVLASLRCPHASVLHWLVAHVGPPTLLLAGLGAVLGFLVLRVRLR